MQKVVHASLPNQQPKLHIEEGSEGKGDLSFPPSSRLLQASQYRNLFKGSKRISSRGLTLLFKPNEHMAPRLGMTIPKRVIKRAVDRNAIKRRIRESFRLNQHQIDSFDIVVMANPGIGKLSYQQISELIAPLWKKVAN